MRSLKVCHVYKFARSTSLRVSESYSGCNIARKSGIPQRDAARAQRLDPLVGTLRASCFALLAVIWGKGITLKLWPVRANAVQVGVRIQKPVCPLRRYGAVKDKRFE
jgi:hypothetical protein